MKLTDNMLITILKDLKKKTRKGKLRWYLAIGEDDYNQRSNKIITVNLENSYADSITIDKQFECFTLRFYDEEKNFTGKEQSQKFTMNKKDEKVYQHIYDLVTEINYYWESK